MVRTVLLSLLVVVVGFCDGARALSGSGDSAVGALETVPPVITGLNSDPSQAAAGETATITFGASEDIPLVPSVTVNGNQATFASSSKDTDFAYEYTVQEADPIGDADIEIVAADAVGNTTTVNDNAALTIVEPAAGLPVTAWPAAVALLLAAIAVLALRRRKRAVLGVLMLLAAPVALAQSPTVSNVAFVQQPTLTGTEVIITYDLDSPNGPSDITVSLSKDGGSDGFAFPVASVAGDLTGVTTGTDYTITWDIAADYPNEDIPNAQLRVTAEDGFLFSPVEMISVVAGSFDMGNSGVGGDATFAVGNELPVHTVTLSAYEIGKFEVTNQQVCDVYNWADDQGFFTAVNANTATAFGQELLDLDDSDNHIEYVGGVFQPEPRTGLPGTTTYSMADHPVQEISWFGAVAFCNWLSQIEGLAPVYDTSTWAANFGNDGYHLPTEAQWERAAAWDGSKHWIYGFTSDTLTGNDRATYGNINPMGLTQQPFTTPVGWFNGVNVSPNGNVPTVDSASPVGAYDMSGNQYEWCHDWYGSGYYGTGAAAGPDPEGPTSGSSRIVRGGNYFAPAGSSRSAARGFIGPALTDINFGFRLARTVEYILSYSAGTGGTLTGDAAQAVRPGEDGTAVTAVPDSGHVFVGWSDGVTDNPRIDANVSGVVSVTANFAPYVVEMIEVPGGSFDMGRRSDGDDALGSSTELPVHTLTLSPYAIGKFQVTNQEVCDVYNWADDQGFFTTVDATTATAFGQELLELDVTTSHIEFVGGVFQPVTRTGDPGGVTVYSMAQHPVVEISWYGAVAYCNWASQMQGLTPIYDTSTWEADFTNNGYHLPTSSQWERAAAWDGSKHWIYGFTSDTLTGNDRATYGNINPMGLTQQPFTAPVGWFNGVNVSPNGNVPTVDSTSPIGAYDMSGNVWEWCHEYSNISYPLTPAVDPRGPDTSASTQHVARGGSYADTSGCRTARRILASSANTSIGIGFRLGKTLEYTLSYSAGAGGSLTGDTTQTMLPGGDGTSVTAVPDADRVFLHWSDGVTDNPRSDTNVSRGLSVTAIFHSEPSMIAVSADSFDMGNSGVGDDVTAGISDELPLHTVNLSAFEIGTFEVTNQQVCNVFNWADGQGLFTTVDATTATAFGQELLNLDSSFSHIEYVGGVFQPKTRTGLPGTTNYSMADHPVVEITWYGAAVFCNWLSAIGGLTPVYDTSTWTANFANDGYHLPTEAQWERAAAWDGSKHWIYGFTADTLTGKTRANYYDNNPDAVNPLGLTLDVATAPVGWFDGVNVSPNGSVATVDSASPFGAYDMSGNVYEWCHDWYDSGYYTVSPPADPEGPATGLNRVIRGGDWGSFDLDCRSANRNSFNPASSGESFGFRLARAVE